VTTIDVTFVRVEAGAAKDPLTIANLAPAEQLQVQRLGMTADRDRSATAHVAARQELGRRLGMHPLRVPLAVLPSGRPVVESSGIAISWSHSGRWVVLAVAQASAVGVDIERRPDEVPVRALRALGFGSIEEFVAREAAGKVTGEGLGEGWPAGVAVQPLAGPVGYVTAVAARGNGPLSIHCEGIAWLESDRSRSICQRRIATLNGWAYPEGVSWTGSRLSLPSIGREVCSTPSPPNARRHRAIATT